MINKLPIVKQIANKLNATIHVETELDIGTTFSVVFKDVPGADAMHL